jgi:leucyl aminopeptidase
MAFKSVIECKLKINLVCTVAMVENLLGHKAYHPMDIIQSHKGLTVEIGNTDAEGRLILCDAMSWTQSKHKLKSMIELSTLTGAVVVALAYSYAGLFTNNDQLAEKLIKTGER